MKENYNCKEHNITLVSFFEGDLLLQTAAVFLGAADQKLLLLKADVSPYTP